MVNRPGDAQVNRNASYPTRNECLEILKQHNCSPEVIEHILAVTNLALKIAKYFPNANVQLTEAGAMLHDLGRCKTHGIDHAVVGSKLARALGLAEEVLNIIERHICAGILPSEAVALGLPEKDYTPKTIEERIVAHADNLHDGSMRCKIQYSVEHLRSQQLFESAERVRQLHIALSKEAGIDLDEVE
jgi:uncharacterized protein (TIGR00295 family)